MSRTTQGLLPLAAMLESRTLENNMAALLKQIPRRQVDRRAVARGGRRSSDNRSVKPTVMIVDAHQDGREMVAYYLGTLGLNTVQAATGPEALERRATVTSRWSNWFCPTAAASDSPRSCGRLASRSSFTAVG